MTLQAKFPGTCKKCGGRISVGQRIEWARDAGAKHATVSECTGQSAVQPSAVIDLRPVVSFLQAAQGRGLKRPKLRVLDADGRTELLLSLTVKGHHPGSVALKRAGEYLGVVRPDGSAYGRFDAILRGHLAWVATNPVLAAKQYAQLSCRCAFCGLGLTDEGSVEVGYGPICAQHWGLPHHPKGTRELRPTLTTAVNPPSPVDELLSETPTREQAKLYGFLG